MSKWFSDNTRYMMGHKCPTARLFAFHLGGTGLRSLSRPDQALGISIHRDLETLLRSGQRPLSKETVHSLLNYSIQTEGERDPNSEATGLVHGWARVVAPWLFDAYEVVAVEEEHTLNLGDDIYWMARPDLTLRNKEGKLVVVDFKSTAAKADRIAQLHASSLQTIMNTYAVSQKYGEPVAEVQIHVLQLGTETWPTPITHAYYRAANPPYVTEDWQPRGRRADGQWLGKLYRRVPVASFRSVVDWVWAMPKAALQECLPILARPVDAMEQGTKVVQAIQSIRRTESNWRSLLSTIDWETATLSSLSPLVPRTFVCTEYTEACPWSAVCFDEARPASELLRWYGPRTPHHPQESET